MSKAKKNRVNLPIDPNLDLDPIEIEKGTKHYSDWHWGYKPRKVIDGDDPDMPRILVQCGQLVRLHFRLPRSNDDRHPRRQRDTMIEFSRSISGKSIIAYDPDHTFERLYLIIHPAAKPVLRERFWDQNNMEARPLNELASIAGGRHGRRADYCDVLAKPFGVLTAIVYYTAKQGDSPEQGGSYYIHKVGEITHKYPFLACDDTGRIWLCGGNYTSPPPGITD